MQDTKPQTNQVIGKPIDRVDGHLKVTGGARYSAEIRTPKLAHAVLVQSTIASGRISRIDTAAALASPGVLAVINHKNAPKLTQPAQRPAGESLPIFQSADILYYGQHVAVVVAETLEQAEYAATLIRLDYEQKKPVLDINAPGAETLRPKLRFTSSGHPMQTERGNVAQGLAQAAVRVSETYTVPTEHHNAMEPFATIASWEGDQLTVYDSTQGVSNTRQVLAEVFGLAQDKVRVVAKYIGGGFGSKGGVWTHTPLAALAAKQIRRPVKLVLKRQQMFSANGHRTRTEQKIVIGATRDGRLTAMQHDTLSHTSMLDAFVEPCGQMTQMLYSCKNLSVSHTLARLNVGSPTFQRAPGESVGSFALESAMDELAHALNLDPVELRNRNYADIDEQENRPFSSKSLRECYQLGAEKFGWSNRNPTPRSTRDGRWLIGYGMATATYPANFSPATARAIFRADGHIVVQCGTVDLGTGMYTIGTQIAADTLGIPVAQVRYEIGDTKLPNAPAAGGSQSSASAGSAVLNACKQLRSRLIHLAVTDKRSPVWGLTEDELTVENGRIIAKNDLKRGETYVDVLRRRGQQQVDVTAGAAPGLERPQPGESTGWDESTDKAKAENPAYSFHSFGAQFCEVRVDEELGIVRVSRFLGVYGAGRILNLKTAISQLHGGIIWGISMAMHEETHLDPRFGHFVNADLAEYHVPVNLDIPFIDAHFVEETDPFVNPLGVKGVGEIGIVGVAAALANAVFNATGKRIRTLPITPDKLL